MALVLAGVLILAGYVVPALAGEGVSSLPSEQQEAARHAISRARRLLNHPVEKLLTASVQVVTVSADPACVPVEPARGSYRVQLDIRTLFGLTWRRAVDCGPEFVTW